MPQPIQLESRVPEGQAGLRLDQVAAELFPDYSRSRLQAWIRDGALRVDGARGRPAQRLLGGERLTLEATPEPEAEAVPQDLPLNVMHQDAEILIVDKPAGLVVHPAAGNPDGTLLNALLHYDASLATVPRGGIVHRLDKDTSGVMVVARTLRAHAALVRQLQRRSMSRVYEAVVHGHPPLRGTVDEPIGRDPRDRQRMAVTSGGKPAVSHFRVLRSFRAEAHVEVSLETGRTHQIRVHLRHIGHPLVGDPVYGPRPRRGPARNPEAEEALRTFPRQALHARSLRLVHPDGGDECCFEAPLPADMVRLIDTLANDVD